VDLFRVNFEELAALTNGDTTDEVTLVVHLRIRLGNDLALFLVGGQIVDLLESLATFAYAIGRFDESEFVYPRIG
jgi:hypothetical protein